MTTQPQRGTALITGANNGIGLALTRKMLAEGWHIIALIRSSFPADDMVITQAVDSQQLRIYRADLSDYESLRAAVNEIKTHEQTVDLLFNNAGGSFPELSYSRQGREMHFELQTVVPYILTMEMKELLLKGRLKTVINTSSNAVQTLKKFDPAALERPSKFKKLFGPYATSKMALSLWSREIASQLAADGIMIRSADPGGNNTLRSSKSSGLPFYVKLVMKYFFPHPSRGAELLYNAALGRHRHESGVFLVKDQIARLKFAENSRNVLDNVHAIYELQYAAARNGV